MPGVIYQCAVCRKSYRRKNWLLKHLRHQHDQHQLSMSDFIICSNGTEATRGFMKDGSLLHAKMHDGQILSGEPAQTISWQRKVSLPPTVERMDSSCSSVKRKAILRCSQCSKFYSSQTWLLKHMQTKHGFTFKEAELHVSCEYRSWQTLDEGLPADTHGSREHSVGDTMDMMDTVQSEACGQVLYGDSNVRMACLPLNLTSTASCNSDHNDYSSCSSTNDVKSLNHAPETEHSRSDKVHRNKKLSNASANDEIRCCSTIDTETTTVAISHNRQRKFRQSRSSGTIDSFVRKSGKVLLRLHVREFETTLSCYGSTLVFLYLHLCSVARNPKVESTSNR